MKNFTYYLITDPISYTNDLEKFEQKLQTVLETKHVDMACFRDKTSQNIKDLAKVFINTCKKYNIKDIYINQNIEIAKQLNFDGIHLTSSQFEHIKEAKSFGLKTIISCHNYKEIEKAIIMKSDMVTYSPIFFTPNKGEPKGIDALNEVTEKFDIDIIALGGIISNTQIKQIQKTKAKGFASIRYFI